MRQSHPGTSVIRIFARRSWQARALVAPLVIAIAAACGSAAEPMSNSSPASNARGSIPTHCTSLDGLPDTACTPGVGNTADVSQATIGSTICVLGYTSSGRRSDGRSVRLPVAYTDHLKLQGIAAYGYADTNPADYEEDHLIPLELGGDGYSPENLWPEPRYGPHPASDKDAIENRLHDLVCSDAVGLAAAQAAIAHNWETAISSVMPGAPPSVSPSPSSVSAPAALTVTITASSYGFLAATTLPGASCTAKAQLPSGRTSTAAGLQATATAGADGRVSWSYGTSATTKPGTGTHTVTCTLGGNTASASAPFTVA